MAHVIKILTTN